MKILSLNAGSSTLKFKLYNMPEEESIFAGTFERIGSEKSFYTIKFLDKKEEKQKLINNHSDAIKVLLDEIIENKILNSLEEIDAIGVRLVAHYDNKEAVILNEDILNEISTQEYAAPLHLESGIKSAKGFMEMLPKINCVGCFDSGFHSSIDKSRYIYGVPYKWYEEYGVRKYGFHGLSYKYVCDKMKKDLNNEKPNLIICHLGQGASICAVKDGKSFDTSMGFTTNSGVIMGTRSGDIDYGIIKYISKLTNKSIEEIDNDLCKKSGIYGISNELSSDYRDISKEIDKGNELAKLAKEIFINSVVDYVSKYYINLKNVDAICFTGGIGSNQPDIRKAIIDKVSCLGIKLDDDLDDITRLGKEGIISTKDSKVPVYVIQTDEELVMARNTYDLVK